MKIAFTGIQVIVGLGNPGADYQATRHNAGFEAIDVFAAELDVNYWKLVANAKVAEAQYKGEPLLLVRPLSYMNLSGGPVKALAKRYGFTASNILVVHDELDIPEGTLKLKFGGGHAGHRGLRSLQESLGADFARLRIGIGRPPGRMPAEVFVLQKMKANELEEFRVSAASAAPIIRAVIENGLTKAMNEFNSTQQPSE